MAEANQGSMVKPDTHPGETAGQCHLRTSRQENVTRDAEAARTTSDTAFPPVSAFAQQWGAEFAQARDEAISNLHDKNAPVFTLEDDHMVEVKPDANSGKV